jgi:hypothetical protein
VKLLEASIYAPAAYAVSEHHSRFRPRMEVASWGFALSNESVNSASCPSYSEEYWLHE